LIASIEDLAGNKYGEDLKQDISFWVISDHARAVEFLICDGVMPSNEGRGYVLRRIIRRAIRFGQSLGINKAFLHLVTHKVIDIMGPNYGEHVSSRSFIESIVINKEKRFADTLHYSMKVLTENLEKLKDSSKNTIPGDLAFKLYDTYGLSLDIVEDVAREEGMKIDAAVYD